MLFSIFDVLRIFEALLILFCKFLLKWGKMKKILSPVYSLNLKNIMFFLNRGLIFFKWSYTQRCLEVAQRCEHRHWKWQRCSIQRWNTQRCFNVVELCKFQRWCTQRCFNVDSTLCDVATSYQPKSNVEPTLKYLLGSNQ